MRALSIMLSVSIVVVLSVLVVNFCLFTVQQNQYALLFRFSQFREL